MPGVTEDGARWLAERGVVAAGADTTAFERIPPGAGHRVLPVHRILLVEHGIHIVEHLALEEASAAGLGEFLFVMAPLRIVGLMMGVWFLSNAFGNKLAGWAAGFFSSMPLNTLFGIVTAVLLGAAVVMFALVKPSKRLMGEAR